MTGPDDAALSSAAGACRVSGGSGCPAHTRLYRSGVLAEQGFDVSRAQALMREPGALVWLDLERPGTADLDALTEMLGLHPVAVEDAVQQHERPKVDRYHDQLLLTSYVVVLDRSTARLTTSEVAAFVTPSVLVTVRKGEGLAVGPLLERWDDEPDQQGGIGLGLLLHGLLDLLVDGYFESVQVLDDELEELEDVLFDPQARPTELLRRTFEVRKSIVLLRRVVLPMREVVNTLMRRDLELVTPQLQPYYQDVYDHVLRAAEWTESLRDLVSSILETNLTLQSNRLDLSVGRLTAYAAILAVTTAITGYYGQNVPYPGFSHLSGFISSSVLLVLSVLGLFVLFRRKGYL